MLIWILLLLSVGLVTFYKVKSGPQLFIGIFLTLVALALLVNYFIPIL